MSASMPNLRNLWKTPMPCNAEQTIKKHMRQFLGEQTTGSGAWPK
jgi:hypothetical protein